MKAISTQEEVALAILQVNVGPAERLHRLKNSQRRESGGPPITNQENTFQSNHDPQRSPHSSLFNHPIEYDQNEFLTVDLTSPEVLHQKDSLIRQRFVWNLTPSTTVGRALVSAAQRLQGMGVDTPQLDAQIILAHVLDVDRSYLFAHHDYELKSEEARRYTDLIVRRANNEPVAYLIRHREFYGLDFFVDNRVLIPRPETELLVDAVLSQLEIWSEDLSPNRQLRVVDVGTGSGAIAIAVARNCSSVQVYATDVSTDAIAVAGYNIERLDIRCQVTLLEGDLLTPLNNSIHSDMHRYNVHRCGDNYADVKRVDIIVANLPYISANDYANLAPDIRNYEPQLALEAGPEGLDTIRRLLSEAPHYLNSNGVIFLEIGDQQGQKTVELARQLVPQARLIDLRRDYTGRDRLLTIVL
ncbi:peptide chain release factor N(5)-glutamine methyltransferase [Chloroflexi bacterium TSY]|nr:peptide chain release factor N(5)-glutamine methyltransferase [Chloroflexi bacterium TSY]